MPALQAKVSISRTEATTPLDIADHQQVLQDVVQRAEPLRAGSRAAIHHCRRGACEIHRQSDDDAGIDAALSSAGLRIESGQHLCERAVSGGVPSDELRVDESTRSHDMQQSEQEIGIPAGQDGQMLKSPGRFGSLRIDDDHASIASDDGLQGLTKERLRNQRTVRHDGIGADHQSEVGAPKVRLGKESDRAVQHGVGSLSRGRVLGIHSVLPSNLQRLLETRQPQRRCEAERGGVPEECRECV